MVFLESSLKWPLLIMSQRDPFENIMPTVARFKRQFWCIVDKTILHFSLPGACERFYSAGQNNLNFESLVGILGAPYFWNFGALNSEKWECAFIWIFEYVLEKE